MWTHGSQHVNFIATVVKLFDINNIVTLKSELKVTQGR